MCNSTKDGKIALPVVAVRVRGSDSGKTVVVHALLDSGSTNSFITEDCAELL